MLFIALDFPLPFLAWRTPQAQGKAGYAPLNPVAVVAMVRHVIRYHFESFAGKVRFQRICTCSDSLCFSYDCVTTQAVPEEAERHAEDPCAGPGGLGSLRPENSVCLHERCAELGVCEKCSAQSIVHAITPMSELQPQNLPETMQACKVHALP